MRKQFIYFILLSPAIAFAQDDIIVDNRVKDNQLTIIVDNRLKDSEFKQEQKQTKKLVDKPNKTNYSLANNAAFKKENKSNANDIVDEAIDASQNNSEQIYMVELNHQWNFVSLLLDDNDNLLIPVTYLPKELEKKLNRVEFIKKNDDEYFIINKKFIKNKDDNTYKLTISLPVEYFNDQKININQQNIEIGKPINALYGRYDTNISNSGMHNVNSLISTTYVNENNWIFKNSVLLKDTSTILTDIQLRKMYDDKSILYIGNVSGQSIIGTNSLNLMGVRYATPYFSNYQFRQDSLPLLPISGYAVNPSKVDLYINNQFTQQTDLSSGKYNLNVPMQTNGYGTARAYVYDILGKPTVIDVPFYNTIDLIKEGLYEYDVSFGAIRKNIFDKSFSYGVPVFQGLVKKGVTGNYTQDLFLQSSSLYTSAGVLAHWVPFPALGSLSFGLTRNSYNQNLYRVAYDRISRSWGIGADVQKSSNFCQGYDQHSCLQSQYQAYANMNVSKDIGNFGFTYVQKNSTLDNNSVLSLQWNNSLTKNLNIIANLSQIKTESNGKALSDKSFYIGLNYIIGNNIQSFTHVEKGNYQESLSFIENPFNPYVGNGSLTFNKNDISGNSTNFYYRNKLDIGEYQFNYYKNNQNTNKSLNFSGGFAYIPESNFFSLTRPARDGIVFVDVENADQELKVFHQSQIYGKTNKNGKLIITDVSSFNNEHIEVDMDSLSTVTLDTSQRSVKMPAAGTAKVKFHVKDIAYNIIIKNVNPGSIFTINGNDYVVDDNGEASVDVSGKAEFHKNGKICIININPDTKEYICEYK
jgi:outer membrane usher protein FimD/PapC